MAGLVFQWLKRQGGVAAAMEQHRDKGRSSTATWDGSSVRTACRPRITPAHEHPLPARRVARRLPGRCQGGAGCCSSRGHSRSGMCQIYNAMPLEGVGAIAYMQGIRRRPRLIRMTPTTGPPDHRPLTTSESLRLMPRAAPIDALDQQPLSAMEPARLPRAQEVGEIKRARPVLCPDRVAQVIAGSRQFNPGPLKNAQWRAISGARSCRPAWRWSTAIRVAVYLGGRRHLHRGSRDRVFGSAANLIYCDSFDEVSTPPSRAPRSTAWSRSRTRPRARGALARPVPAPRRCSSWWARSACRCGTTCCASKPLDGIEVGDGASAGARAMPELAVQAPAQHAERRAVSSNAEGARLARNEPHWASLASEAASRASSACTSSRRRSRTILHRTRFCRLGPPHRYPAPGHRQGLHQPGGVGGRTGPARCTTCWCRSRPRRLDDALRVAPGQVRASGILLLHRPSTAIRAAHVAAALWKSSRACAPSPGAQGLPDGRPPPAAACQAIRCLINSA